MNMARRSCCPVACTLDIIGDKWTLLVIRDLFLGRTQFKEFARSPERISTNILTDRLNRLLDNGLVETFRSADRPGWDSYRLTRKGESLKPVMQAVSRWGSKHLSGTKMKMKPL